MLTPVQINAKAKSAMRDKKQIKIKADTNLYLIFSPAGAIAWNVKFKQSSKTITKNIGRYPSLDFATAKTMRDTLISGGLYAVKPERYTVQMAFEDWSAKKRLKAVSYPKMEVRIKKYLLPQFGSMELKDLTAYMLIQAWQPLETAGMTETLHKLCEYVKDISIFVQNTGRVTEMHDLTHIKANYPKKPQVHYPSVPPSKLPDVFYILERLPRVYGVVWQCFLASLYTLSRPGEISALQWSWVDFETMTIHFPAEIMKMRQAHDVPISTQLYKLLQEMPRASAYVFPAARKANEPINRESVRMMLKRDGLSGVLCAHGIRSIGSTWFAEQGYPEDVSEACLAHVTGSQVRRAYQRSELLEKRRPVMQAWCDFVERCRNTAYEKIHAELQ